jgi:ABC-type polysaccharide/polyol phosphate transport system ATPase subunit/SAM-dependent methyltransferase
MASVLEAHGVSKRFVLRHNPSGELKTRVLGLLHRDRRQRTEDFWALRDVTLRVARGDAVGLVGRNGSGKSTFLKLVAAIHRPTSGRLLLARGARVGSLIELGIGFHPELTGQENVFMNAAIHGLSRAEAAAIYDAVVDYAGLRHFMDVPLKNYSSGMHMRLGFAIAAQLDPDVLLLDEIFAVGDEDFQKQCARTLQAFRERGRTILFVSHSAAAVQAICRRACVLDSGRLVYDGTVDGALTEYRRLMAAAPHAAIRGDGPPPPVDRGDPDLAWHRLATGGRWDEQGQWVSDFLRRQGLRPDHYVLEVGCGSLAAAARLLPYMEQSHYWGFEKNVDLFVAGVQIELPRLGVRPERGHFILNDDFDLSESPHAYDLALASSLVRRLTLNSIARCIAAVVKKLGPGGRFFLTWPDNPDPQAFDPRMQPDGTRTFSDREPFHYSFPMLAAIAESIGARAERIDDTSHPRGEQILVIRRP